MYTTFNIFVFLLGLSVGSFLNCVIYRLDKSEGIIGRSYCPHCKHNLIWQDLIPVFSFLILKGKCRYCRKKISWQYPIVELFTAIIFVLVLKYLGCFTFRVSCFMNLLFMFYVSCSMIVIFVYDLKHYIIPDKILFPAIVIAFTYRLFENLIHWNLSGNWPSKIDNFIGLFNFIIAAIIASAFFLAIFLISRGKWIGFGDVKLAVLAGLLLGFPGILLGLFLAFFFGAIIGIGLIFLKLKGLKSQIPFAPFLIIGTFVTMFWGKEIINWYKNFLIF